MAFIPIPDVARSILVFRDTIAIKNWTVRFDWLKAGGWATEDLEGLNESIEESFTESLDNILTQQTALVEISSVDMSTADGNYAVLSPSPAPTGNASGTLAVLHTAMVVTYRTAKRGRSYRGRGYFSGQITQNLVTPRTFTTTWTDAVTMAMNSFTSAVQLDTGAQHVVSSTQQGNVVLAVGESTPVTEYVARQYVGTIRNRVSAN